MGGDNSNQLLWIDLNIRDEIEAEINSISNGLKYLNIARYNRTRNIDNPNNNSIRSHLIVNIKLAIKLNDGNSQIGNVNFIDLASAA